MTSPRLVLASGSTARARLLSAAGLDFEVVVPDIDEAAVRQALDTGEPVPPEDVATILAEAKATTVSERYPLDFVVGADQVLELNGRILEKAADADAARKKLLALRGNVHRLISAVTVARAGVGLWRHADYAELEMRDFTPAFLGRYMAAAGPALTRSVGAYEIEGPGIQLFARVSGDIFTIQGLPLLPLLEYLRNEEIIER